MIPKEFSDYFSVCDKAQQQLIIDELLLMTMQDEQLPDALDTRSIKCPHCQSRAIRGNGKLKGVQRYVCNGCKKNFSQTTGKFWFALKKRYKINKYMYCLLSGYSIRMSAKETGISIQTSFDWRHKLLRSFESVLPQGFKGIVESDDILFHFSEKGKRDLDRPARKRGSNATKSGVSDQQVAVLGTCDRSGSKDLKVVTRGRLSKADIKRALDGRLEKVEVFCSDSHKSFTAFTKEVNVEHKKFKAYKGQRTTEKIYHVQNVNNMHSQLRDFMRGFHGVATKYLQNYLNWYLVLEKIKDNIKKIATVTHIALESNLAWFAYKREPINMYYRT